MLVDVEHAILREDVQQGMLGEERGCEGDQIVDGDVIGISSPARKLETIGGLLALALYAMRFLNGRKPRRV